MEETDADKEKAGGSPSSKKDGNKQSQGAVKKDPVKTEKDHREAQRAKEQKIMENEIIRDLKNQLK